MPRASWRKIADVGDDVTAFDIHGDHVFLLSHHEASRFKILGVDLPKDEVAHGRVLMPPSDAVVTGIQAAGDALYVQKLDGGLGRLWRLPYDGAKASEIHLPFEGAIQEIFVNPAEPGVFVRLASWTKSSIFFHYDPKANTVTDTKIIPPSPVDFSGIESEEVKAKAPDGTMVPLSIVHQRGLKLDGSHPTLLHGYGSYGITYDPGFDPTSLAWLERGGVVAVAHIRGGGEYGEDWHSGGRKGTKKNTITDFLACAQYLIDHKYTSPQHLAGEGTSAGGITVGGAITERPDLFGAALDNVGMSDDLRAELQINGPANIPEFGTVKNADDFRNLYAISAFHRLKDHTAYPAVLLTTGINDPRVDPWQMNKMTARLQAASSSGKPVLLRVDYDAGHGGIGATKSQHTALLTDQFSFLLWQLGDPDYAGSGCSGKIKDWRTAIMTLSMTRRQFVGAGVQGAAIVAANKFFVLDSLAQSGGAAAAKYRSTFGELDKFVEQYMRSMNSPGLTLVMADRDGVQRVATYGFGDIETKAAVKPDELFQIGSISKSFVANCLLQLHQEGKLDLNKPVVEYLPWFRIDSSFAPITTHHLLTHTSQLPGIPSPFLSDPSQKHRAADPPGKYFHYNNMAFVVLGHLLWTLDGRPLPEVLRKRVFEPWE